MPNTPIQDAVDYANAIPSTAGNALAGFIAAYFDKTDPEELLARGSATLFAIANAHHRLLSAPRMEGSAKIRVFNPTLAEDGFSSDHTVVQIVHDNMPFLVDSVTMAINRSNRTAHWVVHPLMHVQRNAQGGVEGTASAASGGAAGTNGINGTNASVESLILVECDRILADVDRLALESSLAGALGDVRAAVQDWPAMLARVEDVCAAPMEHAATAESAAFQTEGLGFLRWLLSGNFTFLGARDYDLRYTDGAAVLVAQAATGLGILRGAPQTPEMRLPPEAVALIASEEMVLITKAMTRATVHRSAWLDYVAVKRFDGSGRVVGEARFLGLYTSTAYSAQVHEIPQVRRRAAAVVASAGVLPGSHAAKSLEAILNAYPRDELFQVDTATLAEHTIGILRLQERQRTRLFLRRDPFGRFTSAQVFVPRDRYNTELRIKIGKELMAALDGQSLEFTPMLTDSPQARIHYLVRAKVSAPHDANLAALEARISKLAQRWEDDCTAELLRAHGEGQGLALAHRFANAFSTAYREDFSAQVAADDADVLAGLSSTQPLAVKLYRPLDAAAGVLRFKIYNTAKVALSDSLPVLERMGARVLDEHPYAVSQTTDSQAHELWIHDLGLQLPPSTDLATVKARFEALFAKAWGGEVESDDLNKLVLTTTLHASDIAVLRAYTRYFKQLGFAFSQSYVEAALIKNPAIAQSLAQLFMARFDPEMNVDRDAAQSSIAAELDAALALVASLDEDRILRQFMATIAATLRTNLWQLDASGNTKPYVSFKLNPRAIPGMPEPKPLYEIWVYSPRMEGVHLRGGKVARGGLRWSDRREDFRTEVLGLVKAQQVKNTVIVPVGSKGGFVLKKAPPPSERDAFMAEGIACYKLFLSGLLDVTDNVVKGVVVPPAQVVRHDGDDPYLVVAADKGTATFSDTANAVSHAYGFWLGDAFASGGSVGYDHKKMGITARGAWESVKRHFRALGHNTQTTPFTVAGIGDMSGDVFGNGMLLSRHIKLVVAFDHRHIFIDPAPNVAASFAERQRLFALARSSWDDYDKTLISAGGGVFARSAKSIPLSREARAVLGLDLGLEATELAPLELLKVILQAPVDLLYNGGIGTYVKASFESHAQVGDKSSDAFRVNGQELRCKVLAEGGNLGCTQNGRIEFAAAGGRIYTDAIDNSAGVDCSDHEVNIKILLGGVVEAGDLTLKQRNDLLASMTDEVGHLVLTDNYYQSQALDIAGHRPLYVLDGQIGLMQWLESQGKLNRAIEFLPTDDELAKRKMQKRGLTAPENAVVLAYAKMSTFDELLASNLPDDPFFSRALRAYFPQVLSDKFGPEIAAHPLKREIIATFITNTMLNRTGATFVNFVAAEAGATAADVVRAFTLAREIFDLEPLWDQIDALDYCVSSKLQLDLLTQLSAIAQRASRWMLRIRGQSTDLPTLIAHYQTQARELRQRLADWLPASAHASWLAAAAQLQEQGVEPSLAHNLAALEFIFPALDIVDLAETGGVPLEQSARAYFGVDAELGLAGWRQQINRLPTDTLWQKQARASARDDVYSIARQISAGLLNTPDAQHAWLAKNSKAIAKLRALLATMAVAAPDLAPVSVALRELRQLA